MRRTKLSTDGLYNGGKGPQTKKYWQSLEAKKHKGMDSSRYLPKTKQDKTKIKIKKQKTSKEYNLVPS